MRRLEGTSHPSAVDMIEWMQWLDRALTQQVRNGRHVEIAAERGEQLFNQADLVRTFRSVRDQGVRKSSARRPALCSCASDESKLRRSAA